MMLNRALGSVGTKGVRRAMSMENDDAALRTSFSVSLTSSLNYNIAPLMGETFHLNHYFYLARK